MRDSWRFVWMMAWRDSRASRRGLLLYTSCIAIGIAALVAVGSLGRALEDAVDGQAKSLLGADLSVGSRVRFDAEVEAFLASLEGERAREISFTSMIVFPSREGTRLVQVRALEGGYPFYGRIESEPADAETSFRREGGVLVEESLLIQFGAAVGDEVRIGELKTRVVGALRRVPGETVAFATIAPRVYLRMSDLEATGLMKSGSLARYRMLYRMPEGTDVEALVKRHKKRFDDLRLAHATVAERKEDLGQALRNLQHFLSLVGFVALLLGGVGVASAIQVHVKRKVPTIAVLRCLGCSVRAAFAVYLVQAMALGFVGSAAGAAAGLALQGLLPRVVADFVPFPVTMKPAWGPVAEAAAVGFLICVLFALLPLASVRRVSPMETLRVAYESVVRRRDPFRWWVGAAMGVAVVAFALGHTRRWQDGLGFAAGLGIAALVLAGAGRLAIAAARHARFPGAPFVIRQGLANLHRPHNRTLLLVVGLGLGTFLLLTLHLSQRVLLDQLVSGREADRANAILFDIQPDQRAAVADWVRAEGFPILDEAPIVTMRLRSLKGRPIEAMLAERKSDRDAGAPGWLLRREFRSTFTERLRASEKVVAGTWTGKVEPGTEPVPVSVEDGVAKELGVGLGDEIEWDIQGVPLKTRVASLRAVDWRRVQPNFFVLFPAGALEEAPAFHVLVTRVSDADAAARLQRGAVRQFPNVSVVDITLVLRTLDQILEKIAQVIRFMALFTVATGLLVLVSTVLGGRGQRVRESILLRVLGASRRQVSRILLVEYAALGGMGAATGVGLAYAATAALAVFVFEVPFAPPLAPAGLAWVAVTALTLATGAGASRGVTTHPPLEILRGEG